MAPVEKVPEEMSHVNYCTCDHDCPVDHFCDFPLIKWNGLQDISCSKDRSPPNKYRCVPRKFRKSYCFRSQQCVYNHCKLARCVDCTTDRECGPGYYCKYLQNPLFANQCSPQKDSGFCTRSAECKGECRWTRCRS